MIPTRKVVPAFIAVTLLGGCGKERAYEKPLVPVKVQAVDFSSRSSYSRFSGNVLPFQQVPVAFRVGDYVSALMQVNTGDRRTRDIQEGDRAEKGAVLANIRDTNYAAKVKQVESQLSEAQAALQAAQSQLSEAEVTRDQAKRDFERAGRLFESQSITKPEFDGAKTRFDVTQDKVNQARAQILAVGARVAQATAGLQEARTALQDCALRAPIAGTVLKRTIENGALVGSGTVAFVLADTSSVKVVFGVPDVSVQKLRLGSPLTMTSEGLPDVKLQGVISRISPTADPKSRVFDVETTIPNGKGTLKVGMVVSLQAGGESSGPPVMVIPLSAVVRSSKSPGAYAVFVVEGRNGENIARMTEVKLGEVYGNSIEATSGLKGGEQVIVAGATIVTDGERVQVIP
jgi:RND family efflux transporter MFP subunit